MQTIYFICFSKNIEENLKIYLIASIFELAAIMDDRKNNRHLN